MNFSQLHERLRLEVLRRIERGTLDRALLARKTRYSQAHISNFLNNKKPLSLSALDRVLEALRVDVPELLPKRRGIGEMDYASVPLLDSVSASMNASISYSSIIEHVRVGSGILSGLRDKCSVDRRKWDRFVAVKITDDDAHLMRPVLPQKATLVIDRHYNSTTRYSPGRPNIYAVGHGGLLHIRYVTRVRDQLVLTVQDRLYAPELLRPSERQSLSDFLVGRICFIMGQP